MWELKQEQRINKSYRYWRHQIVFAAIVIAPKYDMKADVGDQEPGGHWELFLSGGPNNLSDFWRDVNELAEELKQ